MFNTAIIMAGGKGTRMFPVSDYVPKPLIKINGTPLIDHCIESLKSNGIQQIYVTYGYKSEMLVSHIEKKVGGLINTIGKDNSYFLFNTIVKYINEPVLIIPCDIIMKIDIKNLYNDCNCDQYSYIVPIDSCPEMNADFLFVNKTNRITQICREMESPYCASGIQVCNPLIINKFISPSDNWYAVWNKIMQKNKLRISNVMASEWKTYDKLEQLMETK